MDCLLRSEKNYEKLGQESSKRKCEQEPPHSHEQQPCHHTPLRALSLKDSPLAASVYLATVLLLTLLQHFYRELAKIFKCSSICCCHKTSLSSTCQYSMNHLPCLYQYQMTNYTLNTVFHILQSLAFYDGTDLFLGSLKVVIQKGSTRHSVLSFIS